MSKYSDLSGFSFAGYFFYHFGQVEQFEIQFEGENHPISIEAQNISTINEHISNRKNEINLGNEKESRVKFMAHC